MCEHHRLEQDLCPKCACVVEECDMTLCGECIYFSVSDRDGVNSIIYCETCNKFIYYDDEKHDGHKTNKNSEKLEEYLFDKYQKIKEIWG